MMAVDHTEQAFEQVAHFIAASGRLIIDVVPIWLAC